MVFCCPVSAQANRCLAGHTKSPGCLAAFQSDKKVLRSQAYLGLTSGVRAYPGSVNKYLLYNYPSILLVRTYDLPTYCINSYTYLVLTYDLTFTIELLWIQVPFWSSQFPRASASAISPWGITSVTRPPSCAPCPNHPGRVHMKWGPHLTWARWLVELADINHFYRCL